MLDPILLQIAKSAILSRFDTKYKLDTQKVLQQHPFLKSDGATFVTITVFNQLRGCIGSIVAHTSLLEDIIHNAISCAFHDSRFSPLTFEELHKLKLEVSLLSTPEILEYENYNDLLQKVKPNVDGLILKHGAYQGTFLPQVWEQLKTPVQFLEHLSMKAGTQPTIYAQHPTIYRYRVEHIEGQFDEILPI